MRKRRTVRKVQPHEEKASLKRKIFRQREVAWTIPVVTVASLLLFFLPVATLASDFPRQRCQIVPQGWEPSLDQVSDYVEEKAGAEANTSQRMLTRAGQIRADLRDAQLFLTYVRLMQALNANGQAELLQEQQRWLGRRAEQARASVTSQGGTLAPLEYSGEFARITEERRSELERCLQERSRQQR